MAADDVEEEISTSGLRRRVKACTGWLGLMMLSLVGGLVLTWWEIKYQATNHQQWMVPLGLILFLTPLFIWSAVLISDFCNPAGVSTPAKLTQKPAIIFIINDNDPER